MPHTDRNVVVHMGLPKTGTTFLQNHVFRTCEQIADFGKTPSYRTSRPEVHRALRSIERLPDAEFQACLPSIRELLVQEAAKAVAENPGSSCALLSYEGFYRPSSIHPVKIFDRLVSIFGAVKILITIRQQFEWMTSLYLYKFYRFLKGGAPSFEAWAKGRRKRATWNAFTCCDYWPVIEQLNARAGCGNVLVEPMEGLVKGAEPDALGRLATFLSVDLEPLSQAFARAEPTKQRIDELGYLFGRALYESRKADLSDRERLLMKRLFRKVHTQLQQRHRKADVARDIVEGCFTDDERAAIRDGNSALSEYLGRDLVRFGYPVREDLADPRLPAGHSN